MYLYTPALVVDAIREVVDDVRDAPGQTSGICPMCAPTPAVMVTP
jgi:hypothetical protein